jgi:hypothetical protein
LRFVQNVISTGNGRSFYFIIFSPVKVLVQRIRFIMIWVPPVIHRRHPTRYQHRHIRTTVNSSVRPYSSNPHRLTGSGHRVMAKMGAQVGSLPRHSQGRVVPSEFPDLFVQRLHRAAANGGLPGRVDPSKIQAGFRGIYGKSRMGSPFMPYLRNPVQHLLR